MTIGPTLIQNSLRIGERLCASDLISMHQLQTALYEQELYEMMRLGEIMVLHGWVYQQTADFFGDQWPGSAEPAEIIPIGGYLHQAGLIDRHQIETILISQKKTGLRFGALAILNGYIQQTTLDFFIEQFSQTILENPLIWWLIRITLTSPITTPSLFLITMIHRLNLPLQRAMMEMMPSLPPRILSIGSISLSLRFIPYGRKA